MSSCSCSCSAFVPLWTHPQPNAAPLCPAGQRAKHAINTAPSIGISNPISVLYISTPRGPKTDDFELPDHVDGQIWYQNFRKNNRMKNIESVEFRKIVLIRFLAKNCQKTAFFAFFWPWNIFTQKQPQAPMIFVYGNQIPVE